MRVQREARSVHMQPQACDDITLDSPPSGDTGAKSDVLHRLQVTLPVAFGLLKPLCLLLRHA